MRLKPLIWTCVVSAAILGCRGGIVCAQEAVAQGARPEVIAAPASGSAAGSSAGAAASKPANAPSADAPNAAADAEWPSAKDIIAKGNAAMGGSDAWAKAATRKMKGLYQSEDGSTFFSIEILQKSPNKSLNTITLPNGVVVRDVCDGHSAWIEDARGGYHEYTGAGLTSRMRRSELLDRGAAFLLASTGKVIGIEKVGKHTAYVVEYVPQKNLVSRLYFDVDTYYVVHTEDVLTTPEGPYTVKLDLDDYRTVEGLKFPYRMKTIEKGTVLNIRLTQVTLNVPIDDSIFLKPESAPK